MFHKEHQGEQLIGWARQQEPVAVLKLLAMDGYGMN